MSTLRIGVTPVVASTLAPRVVGNYLKRRPDIRIEMFDATRQEVQALVEAGELDAGFGIFFTKVSGLRRRAIFPTPLMAVTLRSEQPAARQPKLQRWSDLAGCPLVVLPDDNPIQKLVDKHLPKSESRFRERVTVRHLEAAISYVEHGFGVAVMPSFALLACRRYKVACHILKDPVVPLDYYCITRAGSHTSDEVADFAREFADTAMQFMT
jgi:DNA-binding transcriptional LysR family regulator